VLPHINEKNGATTSQNMTATTTRYKRFLKPIKTIDKTIDKTNKKPKTA
jgi:hypothetical protein